MGGNVKNNSLFHRPIRKSQVTEYVSEYHLTWGINPFKLKSAAEHDIAKMAPKQMWDSDKRQFGASYIMISNFLFKMKNSE